MYSWSVSLCPFNSMHHYPPDTPLLLIPKGSDDLLEKRKETEERNRSFPVCPSQLLPLLLVKKQREEERMETRHEIEQYYCIPHIHCLRDFLAFSLCVSCRRKRCPFRCRPYSSSTPLPFIPTALFSGITRFDVWMHLSSCSLCIS